MITENLNHIKNNTLGLFKSSAEDLSYLYLHLRHGCSENSFIYRIVALASKIFAGLLAITAAVAITTTLPSISLMYVGFTAYNISKFLIAFDIVQLNDNLSNFIKKISNIEMSAAQTIMKNKFNIILKKKNENNKLLILESSRLCTIGAIMSYANFRKDEEKMYGDLFKTTYLAFVTQKIFSLFSKHEVSATL